jgi:hypothetical protein
MTACSETWISLRNLLTQAHQANYQGMPLAMVETAFWQSTASLLWLINCTFLLAALLKMFSDPHRFGLSALG